MDCQTVTRRHEVNKCCRKNGAQGKDATHLQFVKNAVSAKCNEVKHNNMKYAHKKNFL